MKYTARDHAFVYGTIAKTALSLYPDCKEALIEGIKTYGRQRGFRMAQTASCFGDDLDMQHYLAYGEWSPQPGEMDIEVPEVSPSAVWHVKRCPWKQEWAEKDMLDVGKIYCAYVDSELVRGFNPDLKLGTGKTQTAGDEYCYFKWVGADMSQQNLEENNRIKEKVGNVRLRKWSYHMAHIYKTMGECLQQALGADARARIYEEADKKLLERYGKGCVDLMHAGLTIDYWITPSLKPMHLLKELFSED
ncbi:MAG: L-2-amino-thiazoline-4-carboxylic acid hydrolase [Acetivibrionales bacterium]